MKNFKNIGKILTIVAIFAMLLGIAIPTMADEEETVELDEHTVKYIFIEDNAVDGIGNLPDSIKDILPEESKFTGDEIPEHAELTSEEVDGWKFTGWNPFKYDNGDVLWQGVWRNEEKMASAENPALLGAIPTLNGIASGFDGAWNYRNNFGYIGHNAYTLGGQPAFCIEPNKHVPAAGTSYSEGYSTSNTVANIIGVGFTIKGYSQAEVQAAVDNYLHGAGSAWAGSLVPDPDDFMDDAYECSIDVYVPSDAGSQEFAISPSCRLKRVPHGDVRIQKVPSDTTYTTKWGANYSVKGAVYGVYSNSACTSQITTLTTGSDGYSGYAEISPGRVYIKEITPSRGFKLDTNVYPLDVADYGVYTVTSTEDPILVDINLDKVGPEGEEVVHPVGSILKIKLDGVEYATWTVGEEPFVMNDIHLGAKIEVEEQSAAEGYVIAEKRIINVVNP